MNPEKIILNASIVFIFGVLFIVSFLFFLSFHQKVLMHFMDTEPINLCKTSKIGILQMR